MRVRVYRSLLIVGEPFVFRAEQTLNVQLAVVFATFVLVPSGNLFP